MGLPHCRQMLYHLSHQGRPYIENPKETITKLLELISEISSHGIQGQYTNHLHSYILTMKNQKEKLRNQSHLPLQQQHISREEIYLRRQKNCIQKIMTLVKEIKGDVN